MHAAYSQHAASGLGPEPDSEVPSPSPSMPLALSGSASAAVASMQVLLLRRYCHWQCPGGRHHCLTVPQCTPPYAPYITSNMLACAGRAASSVDLPRPCLEHWHWHSASGTVTACLPATSSLLVPAFSDSERPPATGSLPVAMCTGSHPPEPGCRRRAAVRKLKPIYQTRTSTEGRCSPCQWGAAPT